jgi:ParB family chromosome partitioning protein
MTHIREHHAEKQTDGSMAGTRNAQTVPNATVEPHPLDIQWVPIDSIRIPNPRGRDKKKHQRITDSIRQVGLKKPITLRPRGDGGYDLVCGQGRLESFRQLGQTTVPAIIREMSEEDMLLMGLVENLARRTPTSMETVRQLAALRDRGYSHAQIGQKVGMAPNHVSEHLYLYDHGEEQLLAAVDAGRIPLHAAVVIARSDDDGVQAALLEALEERTLTVSELTRARKLAVMRQSFGKSRQRGRKHPQQPVTSESIVRAFRREQIRQRQALKRAELCERSLTFAVSGLRVLLRDEDFVNLLRAENLTTIPEHLAEQVKQGGPDG